MKTKFVIIIAFLCFFNVINAQTYTTESKSCGSCRKEVSIYSQIGDYCPYCHVRWGYENTSKETSTTSYNTAYPNLPDFPVSTPKSYDTFQSKIDYHDRYNIEIRKNIESKLSRLGYNISSIDGIFDISAIEAITSYQHSKYLEADGLAGKTTLSYLGFVIE